MKQETATRLILGGLCALLLLASFSTWHLVGMRSAIQQVTEQTEVRAMISETFTHNGRTVTITTSTGDDGDPNEDWSAVISRHDARVTAWKDTH